MLPKQNKRNGNFRPSDKPNRELVAPGPRCFDQGATNQIQGIVVYQEPTKTCSFVCRELNVPAVVQWYTQKPEIRTPNIRFALLQLNALIMKYLY